MFKLSVISAVLALHKPIRQPPIVVDQLQSFVNFLINFQSKVSPSQPVVMQAAEKLKQVCQSRSLQPEWILLG